MNPTKKTPTSPCAAQPNALRPQARTPLHAPHATAQKNATLQPKNVGRLSSPPSSRPLQAQTALRRVVAAPDTRSVLQPKRAPVAPPVFRPQPKPATLQAKAMPGAQRPAPVQPHRTLPAPPVYRPQSAPAVLQAKRAGANVAAPQGFGKTPTPARQANAVGVIQRRTYSDSVIGNFITANKAEYLGESGTVDVNAITAEFKRLNPQYDRADLKYLRKTVSGHRDALAPSPAVINYPLAADFNNHVLGNVAGVGWHSETVNANGEVGYSYNLGGDIASTKRTYWATHLQINGTNKVGNNGRGTFFPDDMAIGEIRSEALYVANTYAKHGQVIIGRGQTTGIMIECLIRDDEVQSAYPYKPGW